VFMHVFEWDMKVAVANFYKLQRVAYQAVCTELMYQ
jgi:hypothetical protein